MPQRADRSSARREGTAAFTDPRCRPDTLDRYGLRRAILASLTAVLPRISGTVLDIGCGYQPYRTMLLSPPSRAVRYVGLDLPGSPYGRPDVVGDGEHLPFADASIDCAIATEVLEHCPDPVRILRSAFRVLKPGGLLFLTVPFLWPLHSVPHDEQRLTPFAVSRQLRAAGFRDVDLRALGGWDASLAQLLGLWVRRRPGRRVARCLLRSLGSLVAWPLVWFLWRIDRPPAQFHDGAMITGLSATASRP